MRMDGCNDQVADSTIRSGYLFELRHRNLLLESVLVLDYLDWYCGSGS
jgi:hypothetical protein